MSTASTQTLVVNQMVSRAISVIKNGHGGGMRAHRAQLAETAIRSNPRRWLVVTDNYARTFNTAEYAAIEWAQGRRPRPPATFIDLWPPVPSGPWQEGGVVSARDAPMVGERPGVCIFLTPFDEDERDV